MSPPKEIGIALLGLGNVGRGSFRILQEHAQDIERRLGARVRVRHILVKERGKPRPDGAHELLTTDPERVFSDPDVSVVVELLGGLSPARELLLRAIDSGRHVVTANKALLAAHGEELFSLALAKGVDLHFEGAVCGGIPIIRTLREALASDRIDALFGIVNGTTNFILSAMAEEGRSYEEALGQAQELGFAEADPTLDVNGMDAAQKLLLLSQLAFSARLRLEQLSVEGIEGLRPIDFALAKEFGYALKLLAVASRTEGGIEARVHPAFLPLKSPLAEVRGAFNAVLVQSVALGPSLFYGQGAGAMPTGSAVVADVIDICRNRLAGVSGRLPMLCPPHLSDVPLRSASEREGPCYLRFTVIDEPGVLGRIATVLGEKRVSIASIIQREPKEGESAATIVVFTHRAREADVLAAVHWIDQLKTTCARTRIIRIEERVPLA
ncbi:MAG: homoserine dehydrogenase [Myxococcota bacterium]